MESPLDGSRFYESPDKGIGGGRFGHEEEGADRAAQEMEARYGQAREEDYAKRDRVLNRLMSAEKPRDVAAALEVIKDYENVEYGESIDRFTYSAFKRAAVEGQRAFEKGSKDLRELKDLDIVSEDADINSDGDLVKGKVRASGYAIGVREVRGEEKPHTITKVRYTVDPQTGKRGTPEVVEETESNGVPKEVVHFGTAAERLALARAHEELHKILVTSELLQNQTILFDQTRAALENAVKYFYQNQEYFTNLHTKWFFTAADIGKMRPEDPKSLENKELGDRRDKAMRLYYLLGMCETREKMENHLNQTQNLEKILDESTVEIVLGIAREQHSALVEGVTLETHEQKFDAAAKFLIGPNLEIDRGTRPDHQPIYTLKKWLTFDDRDPTKEPKPTVRGDAKTEYEYEMRVKKLGVGAIGEESKAGKNDGNRYGERGYLTEVGNPYAEDSRDNLYMLMERMNLIVGDKMAVTEAGRYFWTRGMRDQLGLELYTKEENFPTGEKLLEYFNTHTDEERTIYFRDLQRLVALNGEPVGSDLSKIIHTKWWRLKEMIRDRSAGPYLTWDKFDHMTLSLLRLCRTEIESGETRSIEEQWLGFKSPDARPNEEARDLGEIEWEKVGIPTDVKSAITLSGEGVRDNADGYFWVMNYLSADDNPAKRPYQFVMKGVERPGDLQKMEAYTDKIKFWNITRHDAVAIGGRWREWYAHYLGDTKFAEFMAARKATEDVSRGKKDWYSGLRSMPDYPTWAVQEIKYLRYEQGLLKAGTASLVDVIEGANSDNPGLAVKYGFMDASEIKKPPKHVAKLFR